MCKQGQIEISERELSGTCNSTCVGKSYFGPPKRGCTQIDNCRKKETGWKRFFAQCVPCICDCAFPCGELLPPPHCQYKCKAEWACCGAVCVQIHLNIALHMNLPSFFQKWYLLCFLFCFVFFKCLQAKTQRTHAYSVTRLQIKRRHRPAVDQRVTLHFCCFIQF